MRGRIVAISRVCRVQIAADATNLMSVWLHWDMLPSEQPIPRLRLRPYSPYRWPIGDITSLTPSTSELIVDLVKISFNRQTRREFGCISTEKLGDLLWLCCRAHSTIPSGLGFELQFRPVPSAGAVHPIHVLIQRDSTECWEIYDPLNHILMVLPSSEGLVEAARAKINEFISSKGATLIALVAEPGKTAAKYSNPETLIWRDAGVIIGSLVTYAEALELSICPLGVTGNAAILPLGESGLLVGVGMLLVGSRVESKEY